MHLIDRSLLACALVLCGCGSPDDPVDAGVDAFSEPVDAGLDAPAIDAPPIERDSGEPPDAPGSASLVGVVSRSGMATFMIDPMPDGRGDVYLTVYDGDPAITDPPAVLVAETRILDVDLSTPEASVPYAIFGIPPRPEPYYVAGFLDDDENADTARPRPNIGDTATMQAGTVPTVTIDAAGENDHDVDLNFVLFFTPP